MPAAPSPFRRRRPRHRRVKRRRTLGDRSRPSSPARCCCRSPPPPGLSPAGQRSARAVRRGASSCGSPRRCRSRSPPCWPWSPQPILGVAPLGAAFSSFISPVFFFVLVMFVIAQALHQHRPGSPLRLLAARQGRRLGRAARCCSSWSGTRDALDGRVRRALRGGLHGRGAGPVRQDGAGAGRSRFAKAVMIGIPIASLIGGVGTPAGSSVNVLGPLLHREVRQRARAVRALDGHRHPDGRDPGAVRGQVILWFYPPEQDAHRGHRLPRRARARWARSPPASGRSSRSVGACWRCGSPARGSARSTS